MAIDFKEKSYFEIADFQTQCIEDLNQTIHIQSQCIEELKTRQEWIKASVIALTLAIIGITAGFGLAIKDFQKKPVTVLIENQLQELDKLPLPPLEEIKL